MNKDQHEIQRQLRILRYADEIGHVAKAWGYLGIGRASFYRWRDAYQKHGENGNGALAMMTWPLEPFGQGFKEMSRAVDFLERSVAEKLLRHAGNPVLNMCAANAVVKRAGASWINQRRLAG